MIGEFDQTELDHLLKTDADFAQLFADSCYQHNLDNQSRPLERSDELALARVGVFSPMTQTELWRRVVHRERIPPCHFEATRPWLLASDRHPVLRAIKVSKKPRYKGSKKQTVRGVDLKIRNSELVVSPHALSRLYERGSCRGLTPEHFFVTPYSPWWKAVTESKLGQVAEQDGQFVLRCDLMYPFMDGVFLGYLSSAESAPLETIRWDYLSGELTSDPPAGKCYLNGFLAKTFVHESALSAQQRDIYNLISNGEFDRAIRQHQKMECPESSLMRFRYAFDYPTPDLSRSLGIRPASDPCQ